MIFCGFRSLSSNSDLRASSSWSLVAGYSIESLPLFSTFQEDSTHHDVQTTLTFNLTKAINFCTTTSAQTLGRIPSSMTLGLDVEEMPKRGSQYHLVPLFSITTACTLNTR